MVKYTLDIDALYNDIIRHEGIRMKPYRDSVGKLTIGVGRNLDDVGVRDNEVNLMLQNDVNAVLKDLDSFLPWWRHMPPPAQRALADMCFNIGINRLLLFKKTLAYLADGMFALAGDECLDSKWAKQVGQRAHEDAQLFRSAQHWK